jgi:hypothetical protein
MADGVLTAAVSVTSAVGGIGESLTMPVPHTRMPSLSEQLSPNPPLRRMWFLSPSCASFTCPFPLTTAWHRTFVLRVRAWFASFFFFFFFTFSPQRTLVVTFVWLLLIAASGIYNITTFPGIFRAVDPSRAIMCNYGFFGSLCKLIDLSPDFVRTKQYDTLSGVLLAVTGCEALFAK